MADTAEAVVTSKPDYSRLTRSDIAVLVKLHNDGLTQAEIAQRLGCAQRTVSKWLLELADTTDSAKVYLRSQALPMAMHIVKKGRAADHVAALKGLNVLEEQQHSGVTVIVGGGGIVNVGVALSPHVTQLQSESVQKPQQITLGSDKEDYVNEANSLIHQE